TSAGANGDFEFVRIDYVDFTPQSTGQPDDIVVSIAAVANGAEPGTDGTFTVSLSEASTSPTVLTYTVAGTAAAGTDFTALSGTVTVAAGATSAVIPVEVLDDLDLEPSETVSVTLTQVTSGAANVVLAPSPTAQISIADDEVSVPGGDPVRVQAEDFDSLQTFFTEGQGAAEGSVIRVNGGETGTATLNLAGAGVSPGETAISVTFFDENDGESTLVAQLLRGGQTIPVGTIIFNQDGGGNAAQAENLRTVELPSVELQAGDQLQLVGTSAGANGDFEFVRVDYVDFTPLGGGATPPQNQAPVVDVPIADLTVEPGEDLFIFSDFSDPDVADSLVYSASGLPAGVDVNPNTGQISGATQQTGVFAVDVTATDPGGLSATDSFILTVDPSAPPPPPSAGDFVATTVSPLDDLEIGNNSSLSSPDLETDLDFRVSLTVEDGVSGVTAVDRAALSWVSERAQSGDTTLQVQAADSLAGVDLTDSLVFTSSSSSLDITGSWSNGQQITDIADITDLVNEVIASNGPLDAGDVITLQMTGEDAVKRFIDQQSITLSLSPLDEV
nr:putative Ig domain-containing protein [Paracoccaceae bacterium]